MIVAEQRKRVLIMGAAGRDFHNFNILYREDPATEVIAFTATQIPGIANRKYPAKLAGALYPDGIPIRGENDLEVICRENSIDQVIFAYSDVPHDHVMHAASRSLAAGADFTLLGPRRTMLESIKPVIAVTAIRTGCGKSQTCRYIAKLLSERGFKVGVLRHPMPYGDLENQMVQRFATRDDLDAGDCTNEEREEYEPYVDFGCVIFAGVDYAVVLAEAEKEAEIILWDGGNNDFTFVRPDLNIVMTDALRPGQAAQYHPGEAALRMADVIVVNKVDAAKSDTAQSVIDEAQNINDTAQLVLAASPVHLTDPSAIRGKRVLIVEDGPTITHGGMAYGAGYVAVSSEASAEIIDPRFSAAPEIEKVYSAYPHIGQVLPAVGYNSRQIDDLRSTIDNSDADIVVVGTPFDLKSRINFNKPSVRAIYEYSDAGDPTLKSVIDKFLDSVV